MKLTQLSFAFVVLFGLLLSACSQQKNDTAEQQPPNIVIIYADDMGFGDLHCQNADSKIPTPNLDKLASEGMRFSDAHSSSGICSPSRYALLTGQYHWRRTHGIVNSFGKPMFRDSDITLPQVLKQAGYTTAAFGKWHLGWDWNFKSKPTGRVKQWGRVRQYYFPNEVECDAPIKGGPLARGFDHYFGDGTINFPPYAWVENDKFLEVPTETMLPDVDGLKTKEGEWEFRPGPKVAGWNPYNVLPTLTQKVTEWIREQNSEQSFFLYFALPSPHAPIIPNDEFDGKSQAGAYGDYMMQTDWVAGQVLLALKEKGFEENTLVIFTADNGPERYAFARAENFDHFSMGDFRGLKRDVWEGGHHIPFVVRWPGKVPAGKVSNELISQIDIMATVAAATRTALPEKAAPDSKNLLSLCLGEIPEQPVHDHLIHNTYKGKWGVRKGKWLYINKPSGEHSKMPESFKKLRGYTDFETPGLLFDMEKDAEQRVNLYEQFPEKVKELDSLLQKELAEKYTADY